MKERKDAVWRALLLVCLAAQHVVVMDAHAGDRTRNFLCDLAKKAEIPSDLAVRTVRVSVEQDAAVPTQALFHRSETDCLQHLFIALLLGWRVVIACSLCSDAHALHAILTEVFPELDIGLYTRRTGNRSDFADP
jgi:hypothetical protein